MIARLAIAWPSSRSLYCPSSLGQDSSRVLKCGWYPWDPYQYLLVKQDVKRLTGLDVRLARAVSVEMGYEVTYEEVSWKQHQLDVKNAVRDIAAGGVELAQVALALRTAPEKKSGL
jgi:polar amino acid transport system substrate-binding protein